MKTVQTHTQGSLQILVCIFVAADRRQTMWNTVIIGLGLGHFSQNIEIASAHQIASNYWN